MIRFGCFQVYGAVLCTAKENRSPVPAGKRSELASMRSSMVDTSQCFAQTWFKVHLISKSGAFKHHVFGGTNGFSMLPWGHIGNPELHSCKNGAESEADE